MNLPTDSRSASLSPLHGGVQNYAWGSTSLLPAFLGTPEDGNPQAELWLGAHPALPSTINESSLLELINADPVVMLGSKGMAVGELPYLLKVLAVEDPLSIQVHPNKGQAEEGFAREERNGVPRAAANRSYRDANHKPELICALTSFELMCGFVTTEAIRERLAVLQDHAGQLGLTVGSGSRDERTDLFKRIFAIPNDSVVDAVQAAATVGEQFGISGLRRIALQYPADRGVLVALLMNHVTLEPGEAMYFDAGITHAYLRGLGVEILANSDNVIRAGLTPKHIDVDELVKIFDPCAGAQPLVSPRALRGDGSHVAWPTPCEDFELQRVAVESGRSVSLDPDQGPRIALGCSGVAVIRHDEGRSVILRRGESAWIGPRALVRIEAEVADDPGSTSAEVFLARSPMLEF